jgi:hypothetical protein
MNLYEAKSIKVGDKVIYDNEKEPLGVGANYCGDDFAKLIIGNEYTISWFDLKAKWAFISLKEDDCSYALPIEQFSHVH